MLCAPQRAEDLTSRMNQPEETPVFEADDIRDWLGLSVVDREGSKIGVLEGLYYDTSSDTAAFATVKVGFPGGGRLVFVPLGGAGSRPSTCGSRSTRSLRSRRRRSPSTGNSSRRPKRRSTPTTGWLTSAEPRANGGWVAADRWPHSALECSLSTPRRGYVSGATYATFTGTGSVPDDPAVSPGHREFLLAPVLAEQGA